MDSKTVIEASYHTFETKRHDDAYHEILVSNLGTETSIPEGTTMVERYEQLLAKIRPFLTIPISKTGNTDGLRSPAIPITGVVEGQTVTFSLHFESNTQGSIIVANAGKYPFIDDEGYNIGLTERVNKDTAESCDKHGRLDCIYLDYLEESYGLYLDTVGQLKPEELEGLQITESVQLVMDV